MSALLRVRDLVTRFPLPGSTSRAHAWLHAVDGVSFELERGRSLGIVGESGSGKSTLARTLIGLERASSGSVKLHGVELTALSARAWRPHRRRVQMIFQDPYASLDPRQTILSIVAEPLAIQRLGKPRERHAIALAALDAVGLDPRLANRYPHEFSGGQRQRIGIARALVLEPELLICDEPVSALDVSIQAQIVNLLGDLQKRFALALVFIAHDLAVVRQLCQDVAVMYRGRFVEQAPRESLFGDPRHPYTRALLDAVPIADPGIQRARARTLSGTEPGSALEPAGGCRFHPRCSLRTVLPDDRCQRLIPALAPPRSLTRTDASRTVACHLETASTGTPPS